MDEENEVAKVEEMDLAALDAELMAEEGETQVDEEVREEVAEEVKEEVREEKTEEATETEEQKKDRIIRQQEEFIQKRNTEVGELRKQIEAQLQELQRFNVDDVNDQYIADPAAAVNAVLEQRLKEAQTIQMQHVLAAKQNEVLVKGKIPDIDFLLDEIAATAIADGAAPEIVSVFKANPYGAQPDLLIQLGTRVKLEKENKALKAEIETLRKKPDEALKKVEAAARQVVTGGTGKAGSGTISAKQVHHMTLSEIDDLLNAPED